jgi:thiol:disulfide interchange protein DsbC
MVMKQGSGARKLVGLRRPELRLLQALRARPADVKDVTIYTFLYPILGPDSQVKSRDIWCAKDSPRSWRDWMIDGARRRPR